MAVTKRTRFEVLRRDNFMCRYCRSADNALTVDHVTPVALGGSDKPDNLVAACKDCNAGKTSTSPGEHIVSDVADDAVRWSAAMKKAAAIRSRQRSAGTRYVNAVDEEWCDWKAGGNLVPRPGDWEQTLRKFYEIGLPLSEMQDCVRIAMGRANVAPEYTWRYACGIAWNKVDDLQKIAGDIARGVNVSG